MHLRPIEDKLLALLIKNAGRVLTHRQLLREVATSGSLENIVGAGRELEHTCKIPLATAPPIPRDVNVAVNCVPVSPSEDDDGAGWVWEGQSIVLTGTACELVAAGWVRRVDVLTRCPEMN